MEQGVEQSRGGGWYLHSALLQLGLSESGQSRPDSKTQYSYTTNRTSTTSKTIFILLV